MSQPSPSSNKPSIIKLEPGTYYWCACGQSSNQPFCDGSHSGTKIRPKAFKVEQTKKIALCNCKQSKNGPFCDGSHQKL